MMFGMDDGICRRCGSDPFPADTKLRMAGYRIHARPTGAPSIWIDGSGQRVEQEAALETEGL